MDYKEKYEQAINFIKDLYPHTSDYVKEKLDDFFPELKESEDEKIRKALIDYFDDANKADENPLQSYGIYTDKTIAWLEKQGEKPQDKSAIELWKDMRLEVGAQASGNRHEPPMSDSNSKLFSLNDINEIMEKITEKQGEQKSANKVESKFHKGDWIVWQNKCYNVNYNGCGYELIDQNGLRTSLEYGTVDESAHLWTIADAKDGDVLATSAGAFIYNGNNGGGSCPGSYCGINTLGRFQTGAEHHWTSKKVYPATKEQRDLLFQKIKEAGYKWDAEKLELKKIHVIDEGKAEMDYCFTKMMNGEKVSSAWSEEDERNMQNIDSVLFYDKSLPEDTCMRLRNWLQSIKQRIGE